MRFEPLAAKLALLVGFTRKLASDRRIRRLGGYASHLPVSSLSSDWLSLVELDLDWYRDSLRDAQIEDLLEQRHRNFLILLTYVSK